MFSKQVFDGLVRNYSDHRFEQKGVKLQMDANNWWQAKRSFNYSCMLCCSRHVGAIKCASCPIREAMLTNAQIFRKRMPKQELEWVQKEKELL